MDQDGVQEWMCRYKSTYLYILAFYISVPNKTKQTNKKKMWCLQTFSAGKIKCECQDIQKIGGKVSWQGQMKKIREHKYH